MQTPVTTALVSKSETITPFFLGRLLRIQALVDYDPPLVEKNRTKDVGLGPGIARNAEQFVGVVELDAKLDPTSTVH